VLSAVLFNNVNIPAAAADRGDIASYYRIISGIRCRTNSPCCANAFSQLQIGRQPYRRWKTVALRGHQRVHHTQKVLRCG
jgi:hypothetical protein